MAQAEADEKEDQKDYEEIMQDASGFNQVNISKKSKFLAFHFFFQGMKSSNQFISMSHSRSSYFCSVSTAASATFAASKLISAWVNTKNGAPQAIESFPQSKMIIYGQSLITYPDS